MFRFIFLTILFTQSAFTPAEHCLRAFKNVFKRSKAFANMREGLPIHTAWTCLGTVVLEHSTKFPTWHPGYRNFLSVLVDSDTIRNRKTPPEEETQNVEIFVFESKKLCATASKFKSGWNGTFHKFQPHVIIGFWFFTKKIEDKVSRVNTNYGDSIPASVLLALTLRFLATGD